MIDMTTEDLQVTRSPNEVEDLEEADDVHGDEQTKCLH